MVKLTHSNIKCYICEKQNPDSDPNTEEQSASRWGILCPKHRLLFEQLLEALQKQGVPLDVLEKTTNSTNVSRPMEEMLNATPRQIYNFLSRYLVGQEQAKRILGVSVRNHLNRLRLEMNYDRRRFSLKREVLLFIGPSGSGKTYICQVLAKKLFLLPFWKDSLAHYTEEGYVGRSVQELLLGLITKCHGDVHQAARGILFLDELDKKSKKDLYGRDVAGEGVQTALLDWIDTKGTEVRLSTKINREETKIYTLNTANILFIFGGAFIGLEDIIARRLKTRKIGFETPSLSYADEQLARTELLHQVQAEDLIDYGLLSELVGRMSHIIVFDPLTKENYRDILLKVEEAIWPSYQKRAEVEGFELEITEEAVEELCQRAYQRGLGARGLHSLVNQMMTQIFFEMPSRVGRYKNTPRVRVTRDTITDPHQFEIV